MNLFYVRKLFRQVTGRADLVDSNYGDVGADFYINAGQRFLDLRCMTEKNRRVFVQPVAIGTWFIHVPFLMAPEAVWYANTETRVLLEAKTLSYVRENYGDVLETIDDDLRPGVYQTDLSNTGTPSMYAIDIIHPAPTQVGFVPDALRNKVDTASMNMMGNYFEKGLIIYAPPETAGSIRVEGYFFSPWLGADSDSSAWCQLSPWTLVKAAQYMLETIDYRNADGGQALLAAIDIELQGIRSEDIMVNYLAGNQMELA